MRFGEVKDGKVETPKSRNVEMGAVSEQREGWNGAAAEKLEW